ncbi:MAG: YggS family pyridoxal phosphate-dependent enzyme [Flavobacteriaceae bacterium]|jgi:pyridoxal phosphate enzyme (YggS family)|nr:YggS family pyridoxal phosphate-dependent enzyme [Flavobacteriaceae bacterium]MDG2290500.1 YggS family pyridoxal phosphate-dependent enzyme [Flavobacteriaceae bacterium]
MIVANLKQIKDDVPPAVTVVAVSKTKPADVIQEAYEAGHVDFGENKVQELCQKHETLPKNIRWHMIGHLQRNKVKYIAPFVHLIHGVDSERLLNEINKQGAKNDRIIDVLLQIHIAEESTKFGFSYEEAEAVLSKAKELENVRITGLMGMASYTDNTAQLTAEFSGLQDFYNRLKATNKWTTLSMGMSNDYKLAVDLGSNMIRVGSLIFGSRN